jgi:hypothetical protein
MWATVNTPKKGSDVSLGVELGRLEAPEPEVTLLEDVVIDEVKAVGNTLVEIEFDGAIDAEAAMNVENYVIVEKNDTDVELAIVEVVDAGHIANDIVTLEVEAMTDGKAYTLTVADVAANFTGKSADSDKPAVDSVKGTDSGEVTVVFEDALIDTATAEDVANYSIDKDGTVVAAKMDSNRSEVVLTVEGIEKSATRKLTIEGVMSTDGEEMTTTTKTFAPDFDTKAPKLGDVGSSEENNVEVIVNFDDEHGIDKETAEDVANYEIEGLEILSAEATYQDDNEDDYYDRVILTTSEQKESKSYTLKVLYMVDGSTAKNATTETLDDKFRGGEADEDAPELKSIEFKTLTEVKVIIEESNALDAAAALDASNYSFEDDELDVLNVEFYDEDDNGNDYYHVNDADEFSDSSDRIELKLTVSEADENEKYKLIVENLGDNFGNVMEDEEDDADKTPDEVKVDAEIEQVTTVDLETIHVLFDMDVREDSAEDPTNYVIDGNVGAALTAELQDDDQTVELTVPEMKDGTTYEITVNNVENYWGYAAEDVTKKFIANDDADDTTAPKVEDVDFDNKGELVINFSEPMKNYGVTSMKVLVKNTETDKYYALAGVKMANDDEDIMFNAYASVAAGSDFSDYTVQPAANPLPAYDSSDNEYTYDIIEFAGVMDKANNVVDYDAADEDFDTDDAAFDDDDKIEFDDADQDGAKKINVYFSGDVKLKSGVTTISLPVDDDDDDSNFNDGNYTFDVAEDDDEDDLIVLTLTSMSTFKKDEYRIKLNDLLDDVTDILDRPAKAETKDLVVDVEYDDTDAPEVDEVKIIDNKTIHVIYNEDLSDEGNYVLVQDPDDDEDAKDTFSVTEAIDSDDENIVVITLGSGDVLDSDYEYELEITSGAEDIAGNESEDEGEKYSFTGVDNAPADDYVGVDVLDAVTLKIVGEDDFTGTEEVKIGDWIDVDATASTGEVKAFDVEAGDDGELYLTLEDGYAFVDGTKYTVTVAGNSSQEFEGEIDLDVAEVATGSSTVAVEFDDLSDDDEDAYTYYLVDVTVDQYALVDTVNVNDSLNGAVDTNEASTAVDHLAGTDDAGANDEITITSSLFTAGKDYRIVVKDAGGKTILVTTSFDY